MMMGLNVGQRNRDILELLKENGMAFSYWPLFAVKIVIFTISEREKFEPASAIEKKGLNFPHMKRHKT